VPITRERAERIAKSQACETCGEYSFKRVSVRPASAAVQDELAVAWQALRICGVCGAEQEMGIDEDGHVVYG
jgi:hypothetical protein